MSSPFSTTQQVIPLIIAIAPFPEGFQGDLDETFQQAVQLMSAYVEGNFLTGLILPPGSTLPTNDQGPIAMGGIWYFWDPATGQYLPQSIPVKPAKNFAKNPVYQVQQAGVAFTLLTGVTPVFDMSVARTTIANVLAVSLGVGPPSSGDNDQIPASIIYTVGPTLVPTLASTDLFSHEHVFEGSDIAPLQGQVLSLKFSVMSNTPGTYSAYLTSSGRDCSYVIQFSITAANTWTVIKVPAIPAFPTTVGTWRFGEGVTGLYFGVAMGVGGQWEVPSAELASWQPAFYAGTSANLNFLTVVNNTLQITGVKLEAATTNTYLTVASFEADLDELIRYYFTTFLYQNQTNGSPIAFPANQSGSWAAAYVFPKRMAFAPVVTPYGYHSFAKGQITDVSVNPAFDIPVATLPATQRGIAGTGASSVVTTGNIATGNATITGIPSTAGISQGAVVAGTGIPVGATVVSILGPTSLSMSQLATATTSVALSFTNFSTFVTTGTTTVITTTGTTAVGSRTITALASTSGIVAGMPISGTGIPSGATVSSAPVGSTVTISIAATAAGSGVSLSFGTQNVTSIPSTTGIAVGMPVTGTGIPAGTTVQAIPSGTTITLSAYVTVATVNLTLTFGLFAKGDLFWAFIDADARLT